MLTLYKYHGAGNDFLIADNRDGKLRLSAQEITALCDRHYGIGADGLMLLQLAPGYDFAMDYYNSDGSGGMMCGNGGRCIVAFADYCGLPTQHFLAPDGPHHAQIIDRQGNTLIVKLGMKDVTELKQIEAEGRAGTFLDTGTRHYVVYASPLDSLDIAAIAPAMRYHEAFAPVGANINFIEERPDALHVRTYEKGVEAETCACGTGIVASAIAHWHCQRQGHGGDASVHQPIRALHDSLSVDFVPTAHGAKHVFLTGPATRVAKIIIDTIPPL